MHSGMTSDELLVEYERRLRAELAEAQGFLNFYANRVRDLQVRLSAYDRPTPTED